MGKIKVAVVGIGGYGGVILKEIYETSLEGFEIVAAVEPFPEKTVCYDRICADKIPIYADMETMFAQTKKAGKKPDFVVISTPIQYHTEQILCALRHGAHVLCEKPVTGDIADIPVLEESSRKAGKFLAVGYQWSYSNAIQKLKTDIQNGVFGRAQFLKSLVLWPRDRAYFTRSTGWAGKVFASNGKMIRDSIVNNATAHYIHNILYLLGNKTDAAMPATKVEATLLRTNDIQTFDTATVRFLLEDGAQGLFVVFQHSAMLRTSGELRLFARKDFSLLLRRTDYQATPQGRGSRRLPRAESVAAPHARRRPTTCTHRL